VHLLAEDQLTDPYPPARHARDGADRRDAHRALAVSAAGLAFAGLVELAIAMLTGSVGLLGDALHNLSDVSTSGVVFLGFRISKRNATPAFPYGWERAEDIAGLGVAAVIWASAVFAAVVSVHKLTEHGRTTHVSFGIVAALVGIVGNQVVARYKRRVGRRIQSATLLADAQHSSLDAL
jgi:cation diffusion facilitator family transporter